MTWIGGEGGWAGSVLQLTLRSLSAPFSSSSQTNIGTVHVRTIHSELDHGYCSTAVVPCTPLTARRFYPSSRSLVFCLYLISVNESSFGILSRGSYSSESVPYPPLRGAPQTHISAFYSDIFPRPSLCPVCVVLALLSSLPLRDFGLMMPSAWKLSLPLCFYMDCSLLLIRSLLENASFD